MLHITYHVSEFHTGVFAIYTYNNTGNCVMYKKMCTRVYCAWPYEESRFLIRLHFRFHILEATERGHDESFLCVLRTNEAKNLSRHVLL